MKPLIIAFLFFSIKFYSQNFFDTYEMTLEYLKSNINTYNIVQIENTISIKNKNVKYSRSLYSFNSDSLLTDVCFFYSYDYIDEVINFYNKNLVQEKVNSDKVTLHWVSYDSKFANIYYYLFKEENYFFILSTINPLNR